MHVLVADLDEYAAGLGEQVAGDGQPVTQVGEVGVVAELSGIAEGTHLFRLAGGSSALPSFTSRLRVLTC
jgi:hypothetical protein